jgi:hypothetical protein
MSTIDKPTVGLCSAKLPSGSYCGTKYEHCSVHRVTVKRNLYRERLRACIKDAEDQILFDDPSMRSTNLEDEIAVAKSRVHVHQRDLRNGIDFIYSEGEHPIAVAKEDLLARAQDLVRKLSESQNNINPGAAVGGNLHIVLEVTGDPGPEEIPDLTTGEPQRADREAPDEPKQRKKPSGVVADIDGGWEDD